MKKINLSVLCTIAAVMLSFTACGDGNTSDNTDTSADNSAAVSDNAETASGEAEILNFVLPAEGEEIAVITVKDYGEIKIKLFEEECPKAVENFKGLANMNYYDELIFHRVIPNFMIQGGDPKGNGTGGNSMWGGTFEGGASDKLFHFTGAVAYANSSGTSTNSSQFYIVNTPDGYVNLGGVDSIDYFGLPANVVAMYEEKGGVPYLDGGYTVFGQVIEGMDVVRAISEVETNGGDQNKPLTQVQMESVRIVNY